MRSTIWFPLALLALLAALTLWIEHTVQAPQAKMDGSSRHDPDYKVNNFTTTKNDVKGNPRFVLSATELTHYPDDDSAQMTRPRLTQYAESRPHTEVQAQRGQVSSNGDDIYFMDQVKLVRMSERGELTMLTEYLHLIPEQDVAVTDRPVSIRQAPNTLIRGSGMQYNKQEHTLTVSGRVFVHYERPRANRRPDRTPPGKPAAQHANVDDNGFSTIVQNSIRLQQAMAARKSAHSSHHKSKTEKTTPRIRRSS